MKLTEKYDDSFVKNLLTKEIALITFKYKNVICNLQSDCNNALKEFDMIAVEKNNDDPFGKDNCKIFAILDDIADNKRSDYNSSNIFMCLVWYLVRYQYLTYEDGIIIAYKK